jgi:Tfp pilus assembly protein PilX
MALVVTLALLVLVTVAAMAFFARATANRAIEASRANQVPAAQLAKSGLDYTVSRFLVELPDNANVSTVNNIRIYTPTNAEGMAPERVLAQTAMTNNTNFASLVRQSVPAADANTSGDSTASPSKDGRRISLQRWNAPRLNFGAGFTDDAQTPNWIYMTAEGAATNAISTNVIGRFAYNVYDTGGLFDVNVAGHPSSVTGDDLDKIKATQAGVDLTKIPGIASKDPAEAAEAAEAAAAANAFVNWRNAASVGSGYVQAVQEAAKDGFLSPRDGDNRLVGRQDLIKLAELPKLPEDDSLGITPDALPHLTTFSRALNAPSWQPRFDAGGSFDYLADADKPTSINRNLPNVRVVAAFTRRDGTDAKPDEPLIKSRFPLSKIGLLSLVDVGDPFLDEAIMDWFGLARTADGWTYNHGKPTEIMTLDEVAELAKEPGKGREPDFFELLKAAILDGSLGQTPGAFGNAGTVENPLPSVNRAGPPAAGFDGYSSYTDMHILRIGANIIDQYDADSYPTAIYLGVAGSVTTLAAVDTALDTAYGIENLPALYRLINYNYKLTSGLNADGHAASWTQPVIWNPHVPLQGDEPGVPNQFRVNTYGDIRTGIGSLVISPPISPSTPAPPGHKTNWLGPIYGKKVTYGGGTDGQIHFGSNTAANAYSEPVALTAANATSTQPENQIPDSGGILGIFRGAVKEDIDDNLLPTLQELRDDNISKAEAKNPGETFVNRSITYYSSYDPDASFILEYFDPRSSVWRPYNHICRIIASDAWLYHGSWRGNPSANGPGYIHVDPRTDRFAVSMSSLPPNSTYPMPIKRTLYSSGSESYFCPKGLPRQSAGFHYVPAYNYLIFNQILLADIFRNVTGGRAYYTDPDGIVRPADGSKADFATGAGCPIYVGGTSGADSARRPIILNRPFRSVGEIGYAFRDLPFSSVNFSPTDEQQSADLGLLDVFCLEEEPEVTAGQINPNRATAEIFEALLDGASKDDNMSTRLSPSEAREIAGGLVKWIADNGPLRGRDDLAVALANAVEDKIGGDDDANKRVREAAIRALSSLVNTRTWNLMIDLVAQAGRLPQGAAASAGNFLVEAETHVWLHVAIDRYTGEVVARQVEVVNE